MTSPNLVALSLPTLRLSDDEKDMAALLRAKLQRVRLINLVKSDYYEGKRRVEDLGISIPPQLRDLAVSVGWPGTVVDVMDELLTFTGWDDDGQDLGLEQVFRENWLTVESGRTHLDALVYGTAFVTVGRGTAGEPDVLVTAESTESCTALWDYRARRVSAALSQTRDEFGVVQLETLYLPNATIVFERKNGELIVVHRDTHNLGRPLVAQFFNRDRASDPTGRSEITKPVIYYTDAALRTFLGMEVNREFYTAPQRYALNAEPETFGMSAENSREENVRAGWAAAMGRLNVVPAQEDADGNPVKVEMGQYAPAPPTPYVDQIKAYTQAISSETGIPASMLGFVTENPPSDGSIDNLKSRLNARVERRQDSLGMGWVQTSELILLARDGRGALTNLEPWRISADWRPAATPTRAALADETAKLIGVNVLPPDSSVTLKRLNLTKPEQRQLERDRRTASVTDLAARLRAAANLAPESEGT
ncbi:phage portal protein [Rhodococcus hoagii]|nr:phage portal protein [Prescottella equi]NKZ63104.1 phage portal protein [Prescottella equi]